jgi:hypothetical protein
MNLILIVIAILVSIRLIPLVMGYVMSEKGELTVVGKNSLDILLNRKYHKFEVSFIEDMCNSSSCVPCNPGVCDELLAYFVKKDKMHYLHIEWNVSSIKDIKWKVFN